jgi:hypothetical protein
MRPTTKGVVRNSAGLRVRTSSVPIDSSLSCAPLHVQGYVLSLVNHTHPTPAQLLDDAVVRDGLADHEWRRNSGLLW